MESSWRTLLSVFLAVALLNVSNEQPSACLPTTTMDELGRATVAAVGVFEGRLEVLGGPPASSSPFASGQLNATFAFRRSYKGRFRGVSQTEPRVEVLVRLGVTEDTRAPRIDNITRCSLSDVLVPQHDYLIFVGQPVQTDNDNSQRQSGMVYFQSTAFPVPSTKEAVRQIRAYRCRKCGQQFFFALVFSSDG